MHVEEDAWSLTKDFAEALHAYVVGSAIAQGIGSEMT